MAEVPVTSPAAVAAWAARLEPINPPPVVSGSTAPPCPSWCAGLVRCDGEHMSAPVATPATAGGFAHDNSGAMFPLVETYVHDGGDGGVARVALSVSNPLLGAEERVGWQSADLSPAEARRVAAALLHAAELAEAVAR